MPALRGETARTAAHLDQRFLNAADWWRCNLLPILHFSSLQGPFSLGETASLPYAVLRYPPACLRNPYADKLVVSLREIYLPQMPRGGYQMRVAV
jgi:hypothetical protein